MEMSPPLKKRGRQKRTPRPVDIKKAREYLKRDLEIVRKKRMTHLKIRSGTVEWIIDSYIKWAKEEKYGRYLGRQTSKGKVPKPEEIGELRGTPEIYGKTGIPSPSQIPHMTEEQEWKARVELAGAIYRLMRAAWHQETVEQLEEKLAIIDGELVQRMESYMLAGKDEETKEAMHVLKLFRSDVEVGRKSGYQFLADKTAEDVEAEKAAKEAFIERELVGPKRSVDDDRPHITKGESRLLSKMKNRKKTTVTLG